jgi:hypothetical protein
MNYLEAQTEYSIRLYRWASIAQKKEMENNFKNFHLCKGWPQKTCLFLESLDQKARAQLGEALLRKRHQYAVQVLGETISTDGCEMLQREETFRLEKSAWERASSGGEASKSVLATRQQLKKGIITHFRDAFGGECLPLDPLGGKKDARFFMKCHGWIIRTWFEFGRWEPEISYQHSVWTGKWITKEQPEVLPANCIGVGQNFGNEIGIGSGWEKVLNKDIEKTCASVIAHCHEMFQCYSHILDGLDLHLLATATKP